jgi:hypothetical protein
MTASVSLITPSYHRDFDACRLLCESIDTFVSGFDKHYIVVSDDDLPLFSPLAGNRRVVVSASSLLRTSLSQFPRWLTWKKRRYWWGPGIGLPIYGWHLQQIRKLAMTLAQPSARVMCIDSDNCFCRPFDVAGVAGTPKAPLYSDAGGVNDTRPEHIVWWQNSYRLLGLQPPALPGDDFIGQMIVWDKEAVKNILGRIEKASGVPWWKALARVRRFSEYMLYGVGVMTDPELSGRHERVAETGCLTYWGGPALDAREFAGFVGQLTGSHSALSVQSHTGTSIEVIRNFVLGNKTIPAD